MATGSTITTDLRCGQRWKDVLEELLPPQGRWSEEEYLILTDHRNRLVEFTDGFLEVSHAYDKHQSDTKVPVSRLFLVFFDASRWQGPFVPLRFNPGGKFREPDLLALLSATDPRRQNRFWLAPTRPGNS